MVAKTKVLLTVTYSWVVGTGRKQGQMVERMGFGKNTGGVPLEHMGGALEQPDPERWGVREPWMCKGQPRLREQWVQRVGGGKGGYILTMANSSE